MATTSNKHTFKALALVLLAFGLLGVVAYYTRQARISHPLAPALQGTIDADTIQDIRGLGYTGQQKITVGTDGSIYVAYRKAYQGNSEIFVARIIDQNGQASISGTDKPIASIGQQDDQRVPSIAIDFKGTLHAVWYGSDDPSTKNNRQIKYARSYDKGQSWSGWRNITYVPGFTPAEDFWQEHPSLLIGKDNTLFTVWEGKDTGNPVQQIKFSSSDNGGNNWSAWKNVSPTPGVAQSRPSLVQDAGGQLYLFMYSAGSSQNNTQSIYYATSTDKGATWSAWQALSDGKSDARHVSAATDASGNIYAAWRQPITNSGPTQIVFRTFMNGQWSDVSTVSPSGGFQFFPSIGVDGSGRAYLAWMESGNASGFPNEDPLTGASFVAFMKNGAFEKPISLGQNSSQDFYPHVPAGINYTAPLPVVYEEQSATDNSVFTVKVKLVPPTP